MRENAGSSALLQEIAAPHRSVRLQAISRLCQEHPGPELDGILESRLALETDEECLSLLRLAQEVVRESRSRATGRPLERADHGTPIDFPGMSVPERFTFLKGLQPAARRFFAAQAPEWFAAERNPIIAASLINTFGRLWPKDRLRDLAANLLSFPPSVRMPVLDTLVDLAPDALLNYLPNLLTSGDPKLHLLAIRGLFRIDLPEARKYLEFFLFNEDRPSREMAIRDLFHLPFSDFRSVLLSYFSFESDHDLLQKAGTLFQANPDPDVPYRLMEIVETSPPEKAGLITGIIRNALLVLKSSGLLKDGYPDYLARFQAWKDRRQAQRSLQMIYSQLKSTPEEDWPELEPVIADALRSPLFRTVLPTVFSWDLPPAIRRWFETFGASPAAPEAAPEPVPARVPVPEGARLSEETVLAPQSAIAPPSPATASEPAPPANFQEFLQRSEAEQKRFFSPFVSIDDKLRLKFARQILGNQDLSRKVRAAALRYCGEMKIGGFREIAEEWLLSKHEELVIGALNYLAKTDQEGLCLHLRKGLYSPNPRVKLKSILLLQTLDPREAIGFVKVMLEPRNHAQHEAGLGALVGFDFAFVRELLFSFLAHEIHIATFEAGINLVRANPDTESIFQLFKLETLVSPDRVEIVRSARKTLTRDLVALGMMEPADLETRLEKECAATRKPAQPYSFQTIKPVPKAVPPVADPAVTAAPLMERAAEAIVPLVGKAAPWTGALLVPVVVLGLWLLLPGQPGPSPKASGRPATPAEPAAPVVPAEPTPPLPTQSLGIFGVIEGPSIDPPGVRFTNVVKQKYIIVGGSDKFNQAPPGQKFELEILPQAVASDGVIIARLLRVL